MKHAEKHPTLDVVGCYGCKISGVRFAITGLSHENQGVDVTGGEGTRAYVRKMFEDRRAAGLSDPEPENKRSAAFAPARGVLR